MRLSFFTPLEARLSRAKFERHGERISQRIGGKISGVQSRYLGSRAFWGCRRSSAIGWGKAPEDHFAERARPVIYGRESVPEGGPREGITLDV